MTTVSFGQLGDRLRGRLVLPGEPGFDLVRKWFIGRFTETLPRAVARCAGTADVAAAIGFARAAGLGFALRSGAHSFAEYSMSDGLVIDLDGMDDITVAGDGTTVTCGPGTRIGALSEKLAGHGRVVPVGWCPMVAVAGASMGGGFGPLGRYYGLACDHLIAAEVVLADGSVVHTDETTEPDLLWALRGAGAGNFGAVTSLTFRTRPSVPAVHFAAWWDPADGAAVIDAWQRWAPAAPATVNAELILRCWPDPAEPATLCVFGPIVGANQHAAAERVAELADLAGTPPLRVSYTPVPAADLPNHHTFAGEPTSHNRLGGRPGDTAPGVRFVKSEFFDANLPPDAAAALVDTLLRDRVADQQREFEFVPWGGAIGEPAPDETAFTHRSPRFLVEHSVQAYGPDDLKRASHDWVTASKAVLSPWGSGRVYQNYPDPDLADWETAYYGGNHHRLREIKTAYDPDGVFHYEQSIPPKTATPPGG